jgi:hypothetical protein
MRRNRLLQRSWLVADSTHLRAGPATRLCTVHKDETKVLIADALPEQNQASSGDTE